MKRALLAVALGAGVLATATVVTAGRAQGATTISSLAVQARSDALAVEIVDPAAPLFPAGQITYLTPGTAQAEVSSVGQSDAFASSPYPGDAIAGLPSLVNGLGGSTGGLPPLPAYPFIVNSSYPATPTAAQAQGPYSISATSSPTASSSAATLAAVTGVVASVQVDAATTIDPERGTMSAHADGVTAGIAIGPLVIADVESHATLTATAGQKPVVHTSFTIGAISLGGGVIGLSSGSAALITTLNSVLAPAGITLTYLPATTTATGVDSATLAISTTNNVPSQGVVTTTTILGRVSVSASYGTAPSVAPASAPSAPPAVTLSPPVAGASPVLASPPSTPGAAPAPAPAAPSVEAPPAVLITRHAAAWHVADWLWLLFALAGLMIIAGSWRGRRAPPTQPSVLRLPGGNP